MRKVWNRGLTKADSPSVRRISETMRLRRIDNFKTWRERMKRQGKIKSIYEPIEKDGDLAELIVVVLGDGHIRAFPRCECLRIVGSGDNRGFAKRYSTLIEQVFGKRPTVLRRSNSNAFNISIYEKYIAARLKVPVGSRHDYNFILPAWIRARPAYTIRFLRGLYEAEGSLHFHAGTYTHKFLFSNANPTLLDVVFRCVRKLGFHPHRSRFKIQVSRKIEVQKLANLLQFRRYKS